MPLFPTKYTIYGRKPQGGVHQKGALPLNPCVWNKNKTLIVISCSKSKTKINLISKF